MELSSWTRSVSSAGCLRGLSVIHCQRVGLSTNTSELNPLKTRRVFFASAICTCQCVFIYFHHLLIPPGSCAPRQYPGAHGFCLCCSAVAHMPTCDYWSRRSGLISAGRAASFEFCTASTHTLHSIQ